MSTDRKLAWVGLAIGIVGFIPLFKEAAWGWTLAVILILLALGGYLVYSEWSSTRTVVTILSLQKKVVIHDIEGKRASLKRIQKIRVNRGWLSEYWFRNMVSDGSFGPFTIDSEAPALAAKLSCLVSYAKRFEKPLSKGTVQELKLDCEVENSFLAKEEGLQHDVAQDTRLLILIVELPAARLCQESRLLLEAAGEPARELEKPEVSSDRRTITSTIKNPKTGFTYNLLWKW